MDQETFNLSLRKFLKTVGVETLATTMTLKIDALQFEFSFEGEISLQ